LIVHLKTFSVEYLSTWRFPCLTCYYLISPQINKKRLREHGCSTAIPLISEAGSVLDIVVCRNPISQKQMVLKDPRTRKPLPVEPTSETEMNFSGNQSTDSIAVYMNVYNLDTPIARSEKSCKTV